MVDKENFEVSPLNNFVEKTDENETKTWKNRNVLKQDSTKKSGISLYGFFIE